MPGDWTRRTPPRVRRGIVCRPTSHRGHRGRWTFSPAVRTADPTGPRLRGGRPSVALAIQGSALLAAALCPRRSPPPPGSFRGDFDRLPNQLVQLLPDPTHGGRLHLGHTLLWRQQDPDPVCGPDNGSMMLDRGEANGILPVQLALDLEERLHMALADRISDLKRHSQLGVFEFHQGTVVSSLTTLISAKAASVALYRARNVPVSTSFPFSSPSFSNFSHLPARSIRRTFVVKPVPAVPRVEPGKFRRTSFDVPARQAAFWSPPCESCSKVMFSRTSGWVILAKAK